MANEEQPQWTENDLKLVKSDYKELKKMCYISLQHHNVYTFYCMCALMGRNNKFQDIASKWCKATIWSIHHSMQRNNFVQQTQISPTIHIDGWKKCSERIKMSKPLFVTSIDKGISLGKFMSAFNRSYVLVGSSSDIPNRFSLSFTFFLFLFFIRSTST